MGGKSVKSPKMYICNTIFALITDLMNGSKQYTIVNAHARAMAKFPLPSLSVFQAKHDSFL